MCVDYCVMDLSASFVWDFGGQSVELAVLGSCGCNIGVCYNCGGGVLHNIIQIHNNVMWG